MRLRGTKKMLEKIDTETAPKALGPYSQAVKAGEFLFVSGQLPIDPATGQLITGDIQAMAKQIIENIKAILTEAGATLENVVRTDVFMTDLKQFASMNEEYALSFKGPVHPARQTIQVAGLPLGAPLEISCIVRLT